MRGACKQHTCKRSSKNTVSLTTQVKTDRSWCPRREITVNGFTRKDGIKITSRQVLNEYLVFDNKSQWVIIDRRISIINYKTIFDPVDLRQRTTWEDKKQEMEKEMEEEMKGKRRPNEWTSFDIMFSKGWEKGEKKEQKKDEINIQHHRYHSLCITGKILMEKEKQKNNEGYKHFLPPSVRQISFITESSYRGPIFDPRISSRFSSKITILSGGTVRFY